MAGAGARSVARHARPFAAHTMPRRRAQAGVSIEWLVIGLIMAAMVAVFTVSPELLTAWKIRYITPGGLFLEKIHPATYLAFAALLVLLMRGGDAIGELDRMISSAKLMLVFLFTCALLVFQCVALKRPFTNVIDTFLLPALLCLTIWSLRPQQRRPLVLTLHAVIWLNIALGFYEYFTKSRLVPITLGKLFVIGDWRSTALLGHPLAASGIVAMYIMALVLQPRLRAPSIPGIVALLVALCSLMAFGGRTALVVVLVVLSGVLVTQCVRLVRGERVGLPAVIMAICCVMLLGMAVPVLFGTGMFDNMINRFSSDNGSAHARIATFHLLSLFDWKELILGTEASRASSLQSMMGLDYGIENFWVACIVQYGIIQTVLITIGLACFFAEVLRRLTPGAWVGVLFLCIIAAGSVSFSSKNITLAAYVTVISLLLPRERETRAAAPSATRRVGHGATPLAPSR